MTLRAEVISIGDELTSGQRLDTNSQWISQRLNDLGIQTMFHSTVGDDLEANVDVFRTAARRADVVVASGGLGPTADDLTREAMALAFARPLELRREALDHIESLFAQRKRPMPERNRVQAMFPDQSRIIPNPHGTAPGIDLVVSNVDRGARSSCRIFSLPGVPAEMKEMYVATVEPRLIDEMGAGTVRWFYHTLKLFGIGESDVEKQLPNLIVRDRDPLVGITVSNATITLRIAALCRNPSEFEAKIQPTIDEIRTAMGNLIFGTGEIDLPEAVVQLLKQRERSLGVIEIGAGGWVQQSLSTWSDHSNYGIQQSAWFPNRTRMVRSLGLVENEQALELAAEQMRNQYDLDLCLVVGDYPELRLVRQSATLPKSEFSMTLARRDRKTKSTSVMLGAHPDVLYHRLSKAALNFVRLELLHD